MHPRCCERISDIQKTWTATSLVGDLEKHFYDPTTWLYQVRPEKGALFARPLPHAEVGHERLGYVAVTVLVAVRPSPSFRSFLCLTRITACWQGCRHCNGAFGSTAPGNKPRLRSRIPIVCLIFPQSAAGRAT